MFSFFASILLLSLRYSVSPPIFDAELFCHIFAACFSLSADIAAALRRHFRRWLLPLRLSLLPLSILPAAADCYAIDYAADISPLLIAIFHAIIDISLFQTHDTPADNETTSIEIPAIDIDCAILFC
jgi:hypothetical protein